MALTTMFKNKKGSVFGLIEGVIIGFLFVVILGVVALSVISNLSNNAPLSDGSAYGNESTARYLGTLGNTTGGIGQMFSQFGTVGLIAGVALIIAILMIVFGRQIGSGSPV